MAAVDEQGAAWTVQRMLSWMTKDFAGLGIGSPRLDAELLLSHALQCDRVRLYMDMPRPLDANELAAVRALVLRRRQREPVAYILGRREFYLRWFEVGPSVLIPRPETELLCDRARELLPQGPARVLDLCTGSGAIAITLALECPETQIDATDLSPAALTVARANAERLAASERVRFFEGDLFAALPDAGPYALIVSNPPYVADTEWDALAPEIKAHEPRLALTSGSDGLSVLRRLCERVAEYLEPGGHALFEVGAGQADAVRALLTNDARLSEIEALRDLAGIDRIVHARRVDS